MAKLNMRYIVVIILILVTGIIVNTLQHAPSQDNEAGLQAVRSIPLQVGSWKGYDIPLKEDVYEILETRAIVHRNYIADNGAQVFLSIVHYNDTKVDFHAPEACLGGRGDRTTKSVKNVTIEVKGQKILLELAEIVARNGGRRNLAYYFYKTGGFSGQNYIKMRLKVAANKLSSHDSSGSLVRISTDMSEDGEEAHQLLESFLADLFPILEKIL